MDFHRFPVDEQYCEVKFESFGFTNKQVGNAYYIIRIRWALIQISMRWNETRVTYHNLKNQTSLNALTDDDVQKIWLPIIVYDNTDQKEVTRLGEYGNGEWATSVTVTREGRFTRSDIREVDEAEIFEGAENSLTMNQTYTWEFQCKYKLQRYPFDTQVLNQVTIRCNRAI